MAKPISSATTSLFQTLKRYLKKPWEITGPCASPEYKSALPMATEYRPECPATTKLKPVVPTSNPETVYDIKYFVRDQRRDRPPIQRTVLKKSDVVKLMKEKQSFDVTEFPIPYLTAKVEEDDNAYGGGYETGFNFDKNWDVGFVCFEDLNGGFRVFIWMGFVDFGWMWILEVDDMTMGFTNIRNLLSSYKLRKFWN
ncbi:hypothetical protein H0E87_008547 [Populus deltoides]|uniref:Uncharacterized protein n=1 Tax=Populus deltoides TaxID=3696 RepID=A0A8T2Z1J1_POPDE|nr:hypothetical protein H0E87_008547 [Populus deltoides]